MPRRLELESLQNEYASIVNLLNEAESVKDAIGKIQLEQRKKELEEEIKALLEAKLSEASIALYFSGEPVFGSRAISADFAGKTLSEFQELVKRQYASTELGALGERGPVPMRDVTALMLTGVAQGSFGFLLEEMSDQPHLIDTSLKETVNRVLNIVNAAGAVDDADFSTAAEALDSRMLLALKEFFVNLDSNKATVRLVNDTTDSSLDGEAVHRARVRTEATQIEEKEETISGILIGFLPEHRKFELKMDSGEGIYGSATEESAEKFLSYMNSIIGSRCTLKITLRKIKSLNRPDRLVYRLLDFIDIGLGGPSVK